jgi:ABC-type phosphate transport system permease subunit
VQYGMALTLVMIVLALNTLAIVLRAKVSRKLKG